MEVARYIVGGEGVGGAAHVPVHGAGVAPDAELDGLVAGHLREGLRLAHVHLRVVVAAAVDRGPHGGGAEGGRARVQIVADPLVGCFGVLQVQCLVGECGGALLDAALPAVAVVAGDDLGEALLQTVDIAHADAAGGSGAGGCCGCGCSSEATYEGAALHVGVLLRCGGVG